MKMKKWLTVPLALTLSVTMLAACAKSTDKSTSSATPDVKESTSASTAPAADSEIKGKITYVTHRTDLVDTKFKEYADCLLYTSDAADE